MACKELENVQIDSPIIMSSLPTPVVTDTSVTIAGVQVDIVPTHTYQFNLYYSRGSLGRSWIHCWYHEGQITAWQTVPAVNISGKSGLSLTFTFEKSLRVIDQYPESTGSSVLVTKSYNYPIVEDFTVKWVRKLNIVELK